jgi:hypothetical protein
MKPVLSIIEEIFRGDGKPHPVEGIILFLIFILAIFCFNKWVIQSEKRHERHYKPDHNCPVKFFLTAISF